MQQVLTITDWDPSSQTAAMRFAHNRRFHAFLKQGVKPLSYRKWDSKKQHWVVHVQKLPFIASVAKRWFQHVDYRSLPEDIQMLIASHKGAGTAEPPRSFLEAAQTPPTLRALASLFVAPGAPWEVVEGAYRALAKVNHPDRGGSAEEMQKINNAYAELKEHYKKMN